jgi:thermostable 8-oxoguanine DNA glycosylase
MSARVDQFCDNLKVKLNAIETRVRSLQAGVKELPAKAEKVIQDKINDVQNQLDSQKACFEQARASLMAWSQQKKSETKAMIDEWKRNQKSRELNARAERAEANAEAAIGFAMLSIDEAESAILDAIAARRDADAVQ